MRLEYQPFPKQELKVRRAQFRTGGREYASEKDTLILAAPNPLHATRTVVVLAGNSALEMVRLTSVEAAPCEYAVYREGKRTACGFR